MSRSWDQNRRSLIQDLEDTLKMWLKQVRSHPVALDIPMVNVAYHLPVPAKSFGGQLLTQNILTHPGPLQVNPVLNQASLLILSSLGDMPPLEDQCHVHAEFPVHPEDLVVNSTPMLHTKPDTRPIFAFLSGLGIAKHWEIPSVRPLAKQAVKGISIQGFIKPRSYRVGTVKTRSQKYAIHQQALPILRRPIPPHRFSKEMRATFRDALAQKAQLPEAEVQILHVYDRLFLDQFQTIMPLQDGTLACTPKPPADRHTRQVHANPMYLIMGQSIKQPGRMIQTVVPMAGDPS